MIAATPPVSAARGAKDRLRDTTRFAIIARHLAFNATNQEIVDALAAAGHDLAERTLQRVMKREDFIRYYEAFQGDINARIARLVEESCMLAAPEAFNHLVRLMRGAKSSETERQAANDILKYAGLGRTDGPGAVHFHLPPALAQVLAVEGAKIASGAMQALQIAPAQDIEATFEDLGGGDE